MAPRRKGRDGRSAQEAKVAEEVRFFMRVALFTIVIATVYWFVSYEEAGTALLVGIIASAAFFAFLVVTRVRASWSGRKSLKGLLGFEESGRDDPLSLGEDTFPSASAWPPVASVAAVLVATGLVYGPWLWIPGVSIALATTWGWLTELE